MDNALFIAVNKITNVSSEKNHSKQEIMHLPKEKDLLKSANKWFMMLNYILTSNDRFPNGYMSIKTTVLEKTGEKWKQIEKQKEMHHFRKWINGK